MEFEKGDYIVNINSLKAKFFDELSDFVTDKESDPNGDMVLDRFLTYMDAVSALEEVGTNVGD